MNLQEYNEQAEAEARTQAHISMTACLNSGPVKPPFLNPDRPLTGKPRHYLTGLECGCETLTTWPMALFKYQLPDYKELRGIYQKPSINETGE